MGKIKFLGFLAALFAVSISLTSCNRSDDPVGKDKVTDIKTPKSSVLATSNVSAKYSIDAAATSDFAADGKKAIFRDIESSSVKVTAEYTGADADKYVNAKQTATVNFSSKPYGVPIDFVFVEKSVPVAQAVAIGGAPVVNKDQSVTIASITIPEGTKVTGSTEGFAITAYKTPANILADIANGDKIKASGYVLSCQPDGAKFDKPVTLKMFVGKGLAGLPLTLESGNETVEGKVDVDGYASFGVTHFSDWISSFPFEVIDGPTTSSDLLSSITVNVAPGLNAFSYTKKIGNDFGFVGGNVNLYPYVHDIAKIAFGDDASNFAEEGSFMAEGAGVAKIDVSQNKRKMVLDYSGVTFSVARYENVAYEITITGVTPHSGGSGK